MWALLKCAGRVLALLGQRRIHQPTQHVGRPVLFADSTMGVVYRETTIDNPSPGEPSVLIVGFRLRWVRGRVAHAAFRLESELNTVFFAGFPGLVSKLWLRNDEHGVYRGLYQWNGPEEAVAYVRAVWWVLALVSEPATVHYALLPGLDRDEVLDDPGLIDALATAPGGWWRPAATPSGAVPGF